MPLSRPPEVFVTPPPMPDAPSHEPVVTIPLEDATTEDLLNIAVRRLQSARALLVAAHG